MARMLDYNIHAWTWSLCSRHYITEFLELVIKWALKYHLKPFSDLNLQN